MLKAGIYCRLSVEDKNKILNDDSQSIQNQKAMLCDYCREHGWEIYDIYCDDGYSGIDSNRPEFQRLLRDCEAGDIDIVLCKDQSRFSRDIIIVEKYINDRFLEWGVRFIGVADNADSDSETYSTMRLFTGAYNEMYVKDISEKIRRTLSYKRQQGQFVGSFAPYGYEIDPDDRHHLIIDEETAPFVKLIFDMYVQGNGYRKIVQELNSRGIISPSAYKARKGSNYVNRNAGSKGLWTQSTIYSMLRNEMYTGAMVQGKSHHISYRNKKRKKVDRKNWVRIAGTHEAIIDPDTWERTQERLNSRTRVTRASQEIPALSGKVRCAVCGRPMKRNVYYNKNKTIKYYGLQCATYKTGAMDCPNTRTISGKILEEKITYELNIIIKKYFQYDKINIIDFREEKIGELKKQLEFLGEQQKTENERIEKIYVDRLDGIITNQEYIKYHNVFLNKIMGISHRIENISRQIEELETDGNRKNQSDIIENYTHFTGLERVIADEFIDYIEIGENKNNYRDIYIHWKI